MISKMKSGSVNASSAFATFLLALSMAFGASRAPAEDLDATSCLNPTVVAENRPEVTEALELTCLSSRADAQTFEAAPSAIEGQAIPIEITQSATVAAPGHDVADGAIDIAGAAPFIAILHLKRTQRPSLLARDLGKMPASGVARTVPGVAHRGGVHHVHHVAVKRMSRRAYSTLFPEPGVAIGRRKQSATFSIGFIPFGAERIASLRRPPYCDLRVAFI